MPGPGGTWPLAVGVVKFASCDGCQLALLGLGSLLLELGERFHIVEFGVASSNRPSGPYALVGWEEPTQDL